EIRTAQTPANLVDGGGLELGQLRGGFIVDADLGQLITWDICANGHVLPLVGPALMTGEFLAYAAGSVGALVPISSRSDRNTAGRPPAASAAAASTVQGPTNTYSAEPAQGMSRPRRPFNTK